MKLARVLPRITRFITRHMRRFSPRRLLSRISYRPSLKVWSSGVLVLSALLLTLYVLRVEHTPFSFGLDLAGGTQLTYTADISEIPEEEVRGRMEALQQVIERRVNALGVSEPSVYTSRSSAFTGLPQEHRLVVELPGVTDIEAATKAIGETPYLEFKILDEEAGEFVSAGLQGGHVSTASVQFRQSISGALTNEPIVVLQFNGEGADRFATLTREQVGNYLGIYLDGAIISSPIIRQPILGGTTQIEGNFTLDSARELADGLSLGALPIPITLSGTRTVHPSLGETTVEKSLLAGLFTLLLLSLLFLVVYRFVGLVALVALAVYCTVILALFKGIPIVLTAAGLAGFIMSIGFAVDANVLIFERIREDIERGIERRRAIEEGCARAWLAIRDANLTSVIIAFILFWFGTSLIKGFAFAFLLGVLLSMLSAYLLTRLFLRASADAFQKKGKRWYIR